jgi:para-nitrobenzyl esterase
MVQLAQVIGAVGPFIGGLRVVPALFAVILSLEAVQAIEPVARTESGLVRGSGADVVSFKGIPYAAPPVGPLRWKPPAPAVAWEGTREATEFCASCPQPAALPGASKQSEDCLTLNIWTPAKSAKERLPVMVWIYGGGFMIGSSAQPTYDGETLARQGAVVVTFNYRLGALGFLAHPELSRESPQGVSGNYGLLDQIAALRWVQRNIENFGGDRRRVTIFGESAGGASVVTLLVSPLAKGLFHRAIAQSPTFVFTPIRHLRESWYGYRSAESEGAALGDLATLRARSVQELVKSRIPGSHAFFDLGLGGYRPVVDGWVVPDDPSDLYERGRFNRVPVLAGTNADEGALFVGLLIKPAKTPAAYRAWLTACFGEEPAGRIFEAYPAAADADATEAEKDVITDFFFVEPTVSVLRAVQSKVPAYRYRFSRVNASGKATKMGAPHGAEVVYVFGTFKAPPALPLPGAQVTDETDLALSREMMAAWVRFAARGDPNGPGLVKWPRYSADEERCLQWADTPGVIQAPDAARISLLNSLFSQFRAARLKTER